MTASAADVADGVLAASALYASIWAIVRRIPRGRVATYGQVAALAGYPRQPRAAGYALHSIPDGYPWHRVLNARGEISARSHSAEGNAEMLQQRLLEAEGVRFLASGRLDLARYQWKPRLSHARPTSPIRRH